MDWIRHDLQQAFRMLARRPGFSALAILTLALGLSISTVAFSAVNALLFKPLRFEGADTTGWLFVATARDSLADSSLPVFEAIERRSTTLDAVAAEGRQPLAYDTGHGTEQIWALFVSPAYFNVVRTTPLSGRLLGSEDGTSGEVPVVVSERFWRRRLDADPAVAARVLLLNRRPARIVGVMRDGFQGPGGVFEPDVWVPLATRHALTVPARYDAPDATWLTLVARPRAGTLAAALEQELVAIAADAGLAEGRRDDLRVRYVRFADGHPEVRQLTGLAAVGLSAVSVVLLIACFNVSGLVIARTIERRRDLGLRSALGASRWRLAREQLTESLVLAAAAGGLAVLVTRWSAAVLAVFSLPAPIPQRLHFAMDWRVLTFTAGLALVAAVLPALAPIAQVVRADLARWLGTSGTAQAGGLGHRRTRRAFVILQVTGSTCFLALALIFGRHFVSQWRVDPGFDADHVAAMEIDLAQDGYTPERARELVERILTAARGTPGVTAVAAADRVSFSLGTLSVRSVSIDGRDCREGGCLQTGSSAVNAGFFDAMGIPLLAGRSPDPGRPGDRDAVVVSATAAERLWPGASPIGRTFRTEPDGRTFTVIGVAADVAQRAIRESPQPYFYRALAAEDYGSTIAIVARASDDAALAVGALSQALHVADAGVPPHLLQTMSERMALFLWAPRTAAGFFGACAAAAVLLSTIGLFGVTYFAVSQRRREFGVRLAMGATRNDVRRLVLGEALRLAGPGIAAGAALAILLGLVLRSRVLGVVSAPVSIYVAAVLLQSAVTLLASWSPAARAARSSPIDVLREG